MALRPFEYIRTRGANDLALWREWREKFTDNEMRRRPLESADRRTSGGSRDAGDALASSEPVDRLVGLLLVSEQGKGCSALDEQVIRSVFDDPDARVRGGAVAYLVRRAEAPGALDHVIRAVAREVAKRFASLHQDVALCVATEWVRTLLELASPPIPADRAVAEPEFVAGIPEPVSAWTEESALTLLRSADPRIQLAVLRVCPPSAVGDAFLRACECLLEVSPYMGIRVLAVQQLSRAYLNSSDARVSALLARVVKDEASPVEVRELAYHALFRVNAYPLEEWPEVKWALHDSSFPAEVDWELVADWAKR